MPNFHPLSPEDDATCNERLDQLDLVIAEAKARAQSILPEGVELVIAIGATEVVNDPDHGPQILMTCGVHAFSDDPGPANSRAMGLCMEGAARAVYGQLEPGARRVWYPLTEEKVVN